MKTLVSVRENDWPTIMQSGLPWWSSGLDAMIPMQWVWVWSLVLELRSHMPSGHGKKKEGTKIMQSASSKSELESQLDSLSSSTSRHKGAVDSSWCFKRWEWGRVRKLEWIIWLEVLKQTWESVAPCTRVVRVKVVKLCWGQNIQALENWTSFHQPYEAKTDFGVRQ